MSVHDLAARRGQPRQAARAQLRIDPKDGALTIRLPGSARWAVPADAAEPLLERLLAALRRRRQQPLIDKMIAEGRMKPPKPPRADGTPTCKRQRDGGLLPFGGCRRRAGHTGLCRDAEGDYTPAICLHVGFGVTQVTIAATGAEHLHCRHCNAEIVSPRAR